MHSRLEWNRTDIERDFPECQNVSEIIHRLENQAAIQGQVVCEIWINEMRILEDDEIQMGKCLTNEISQLAIVMSPTNSVVDGTLEAILDYLPRLQKGAESVSDQLRGVKEGFSYTVFLQVVEGSRWIVESLMRAGRVLPLHEWTDVQAKWKFAEKRLEEVVKDLLQAFEKRDFVLLADLLEYELTTIIQDWIGVIQASVEQRNQTQNSLGRR